MALTFDSTFGGGTGVIIVENDAISITTASFSTAADIRLVALVSSEAADGTTIDVSGGGLSWSQEESNEPAVATGLVGIFIAYSATPLSGITINAAQAGDTSSTGMAMTVVGILGAEVTHGGASEIAAGNGNAVNITTTRAGSYLFATGADASGAGDYDVSAASDPVQTLLNTRHDPFKSNSEGQWRSTNTLAVDAYTMECNGTRNGGIAAIEIREPAASGPPPTAGVTHASRGSWR